MRHSHMGIALLGHETGEPFVSQPACRYLYGFAGTRGLGVGIETHCMQPDAVTRGPIAHHLLVAVRLAASQTEVAVRSIERHLATQQQRSERHGVDAAAYPHEQPLSAAPKAVLGHIGHKLPLQHHSIIISGLRSIPNLFLTSAVILPANSTTCSPSAEP